MVWTVDRVVTHSLYIDDPDRSEIELYSDVQPAGWKTDPSAIFAQARPLRL
jgi:catechol-2,3-dioxygenase